MPLCAPLILRLDVCLHSSPLCELGSTGGNANHLKPHNLWLGSSPVTQGQIQHVRLLMPDFIIPNVPLYCQMIPFHLILPRFRFKSFVGGNKPFICTWCLMKDGWTSFTVVDKRMNSMGLSCLYLDVLVYSTKFCTQRRCLVQLTCRQPNQQKNLK